MKIIIVIITAAVLLTGCSHNPTVFALGERTHLGFGPPETSANWTSTKGLFVADVSRENSGFSIEIDSKEGVSIDQATGNLKGVKKITKHTGPQITGYLVELAKNNPDLARLYIEAMLREPTQEK